MTLRITLAWLAYALLIVCVNIFVYQTAVAGCIQTCTGINAWGKNNTCDVVTDRGYCCCVCGTTNCLEAYRWPSNYYLYCVEDTQDPVTQFVAEVACPNTMCSELSGDTCQQYQAPSVTFTTSRTSTICQHNPG
jgi:hypothetical protein